MPFSIPSLDETRDVIVAFGRALFRRLNWTKRSYHGRRATYLAAGLTELHYHADSVQRDLHPLTAGDGKPINDWGNATGVLRKNATPARKSAAARVRGGAGRSFATGQQLKHIESGLIFKIDQAVTIPGVLGVDPASFVDADIVGIDTGSKTRLDAGSTLTFLSPPVGIEPNVILQLDLDEDGFDEEQFGSYRARFLSTFSETPAGGNRSDFTQWALESLATVSKAFAYPERAGKGTIDVVGFYAATGSSRSLSSDDRDAVLAYIKTKAPFQVSGEGGGLRVLLTVPDPKRVEIMIEPNGIPAFNFDWDDSSLPTVIAFNATTNEIQFSGGALPASLRAGHRLIVDGVASVQDGSEFKIDSISAVDKVILRTAPAVPFQPTDKIYSGGPLVGPIRDAVVGHLNGEIIYAGRGLTPIPESKTTERNPDGTFKISIVGLDILADSIGPANPAPARGPWTGGILLSTLSKIATYKTGVRNATIVSPATDYQPPDDPFPGDAQIHFVTPGAVVIRKAH